MARWLLLLVVLVVVGGEECGEEEEQEVQARVAACVAELNYQLEAGGEECAVLQVVVERCGGLWRRCHTPREAQRLVDQQVEALLVEHRGMARCPASLELSRCLHHTIPYHSKLYHNTPYLFLLYHAKPFHTRRDHTIPHHTIPHHSTLDETIPYHTTPYHTIPH